MQNQMKFRLPRMFSDGMVLQRNTNVKIWGYAPAEEAVTVRFKNHVCSGTADKNGQWMVSLRTDEAGGPFEMLIETGGECITLHNILLGDVWLCSGQSNMEMKMLSLRQSFPEEIAQADNDAIRQFLVPVSFDFERPHTDFESGDWEAADPASVLNFTAAGYFFAAKLYEKDRVPIGLINASLGGAPVQAFMSEHSLAPFAEYMEELQRLKNKEYLDALAQKDQINREQWYTYINQNDAGMPANGTKCYEPGFDASAWLAISVPSYWEDSGLGSFNGVVWFRKEIEVPSSWLGYPATLELGNVVDEDTVYLNGTQIGTLPNQYISRKYNIPEGLLREGKNTLVVRVVNFSGKGGFYKDKPYCLHIGDRSLDISGEWQHMIGVKSGPMPEPSFVQWRPAGLYNGMIAPIAPYAIKGVIWYQGESNLNKPEAYESLFQALIGDWRGKWGLGAFPFLYVQLPNFAEPSDRPVESQWAVLREAQRKTLALPMTGMAVTIDIGEWNDIHPVNKMDVGYRLALAARKVAYGDEEAATSGPMYQFAEKKGDRIVLHFSDAGGGLVARDGGKLNHFAIAGANQRFVWANARIEEDHVVVWHNQVPDPARVRYAWADNPVGANLYSREGLPASPFATD
ncbi:sialate O-acetylesterase [Paenibacillus sp. YIM B09110]|uniref:sialate O-acetylesterase n=1 Tax=Paenibacillus sp. YIM B09110 TaxID=3126102 RepID=UPI00301BB8DE